MEGLAKMLPSCAPNESRKIRRCFGRSSGIFRRRIQVPHCRFIFDTGLNRWCWLSMSASARATSGVLMVSAVYPGIYMSENVLPPLRMKLTPNVWRKVCGEQRTASVPAASPNRPVSWSGPERVRGLTPGPLLALMKSGASSLLGVSGR